MSSTHAQSSESAWRSVKSAEVSEKGGRNDERLAAPNNDEQLEHTTGNASPSINSLTQFFAAATSTEADSEVSHDQPPIFTHRRTSSLSSSLIVVGSREDDHHIEEDWDSLEENDIAQAKDQSKQSSFSAAYFGSDHNPKSYQAAKENQRKPGGLAGPRDRSHFATARPVKRTRPANMESESDYHDDNWQQAGKHADAQDLAGPGLHGRVECTVTDARKENEGTQNQYISYLVTTNVSTVRDLAVTLELTCSDRLQILPILSCHLS